MMLGIDVAAQAAEAIARCVKIGVVSSVDAYALRARVAFPDRDDAVSYALPILTHGTAKGSGAAWLPEVDDHVLCVFLPTGDQAGFVIGTYYSPVRKLSNAFQAGRRILAGVLSLGREDAADDADLGVVRKKDLQAAIEDVNSAFAALNSALLVNNGADFFTWTEEPQRVDGAKASAEVYAS